MCQGAGEERYYGRGGGLWSFTRSREEIQRKGSKRGYKDSSQLDFPVEGEEEMSEEEEEPPTQRRRTEEAEGEAESEPQAEGGTGHETTSGEADSSSSSSSSDSKEEPEGERIAEDQMDSAIRSVVHNENLDGTPVRRDPMAAEPYGPTRARLEQMRFKPYNFFVIQEGEEVKQGDEEINKVGEHDEWVFCEERRSLIRRHGEYRKGSFVPVEKRSPNGSQVPSVAVQSDPILS